MKRERRSTSRRYAMVTPASVHSMSRQLVFGDLSCTGFRRETWHPRHHELFAIHRTISHWIIVCSCCSSWIGTILFSSILRTRPRTRRGLRQWHCISLVSFQLHVDIVYTRCFLCTQPYLKFSWKRFGIQKCWERRARQNSNLGNNSQTVNTLSEKELLVTCYRLHVTYYRLQATKYKLQITSYNF